MENSEMKWESYEEYIFNKEWYEVLEKEWWETGGIGYEKSGIRTKNYERKQELRNHSKDEK